MIACWYANRWDYSCFVADLTRHTAKEDAKAEGEHQQQLKGPSLSNLKTDQVVIKGNRALHPGGPQRTTARIDAALPNLCSHLGHPNGEKT